MIPVMLISTTFDIPGAKIVRYKGLVRGVIVRTPTIAQGFTGVLKSVIGGNISSYSEMCEQTRDAATTLMWEQAKSVGGNAVVGFRYDASSITGQINGTEIVAYGTAVTVEENRS